VLPAGAFKVRSNDTDYRFRADTAHTYFCGNQTSDAVLVIQDGEAVLYARPSSSRDTDEFFRDRMYGELWVGRRPSLKEISDSLGLEVRHIDELAPALGGTGKTRVHRGVSSLVDTMVAGDDALDADFARVASEMRLIKDDWEIGELQTACDITALGFEDSVAEWSRVLEFGERWIEGTFFRRARAMGNDIGYDSIVGRRARTPPRCTGSRTPARSPRRAGAARHGRRGAHLYTADVTRTLPVDGTFTPLQRDLYTLVLRRQQAGIDAVRPGEPFRAAHTPRWTCSRTASTTSGCCRSPARRRSTRTARSTPLDAARHQPHARHGRARLRPAAPRLYPRAPRRGHGAHRRARACTSRRTTCSSPRSCAASASGSRTTSWSPPTAAATCPAAPPHPDAIEEWMGALRS
jgi:Xaa-Pro aminopeptidase